MSEFHYARTTGVDGGVDACDGPAIGVDLESVLKDGLPPVSVALGIISALCEIIDIADQDGEIHGHIDPSNVFIDETGAVSVEGFGKKGRKSIAPEGEAIHQTDLYAIGYMAYRMFAHSRLVETVPKDAPDRHDDAVIDSVIQIDFSGVPEEMQGDIQWYVAKLMSFDPDDRPSAVDAWRTFIAFASAIGGGSLEEWGEQVVNGQAQLRSASSAPAPAPAGADEDLGGPVQMSGPLARGGLSFGGGNAKPGQATAFWSRDQMKAALDAEEPEDEASESGAPAPSFKPQVGGGSATAFWSMDQMKAMAEGREDAPRPKRKGGTAMMPAPPRQTPKKPDEPAARTSAPPPKPPPPQPPPQPQVAQVAQAAPQNVAIAAATPQFVPPPIQQMPQPEPAQGGGMPVGLIVGVVLVLFLVCAGVASMGGLAALFAGGSSEEATASTPPNKPDEVAERDKTDTGAPAKAKADEPKKEEPKKDPPKTETKSETKSTTKSSTPSTTKTGTKTTKSSGGSVRPKTSTAAPSTGPVSVSFALGGRGKIGCGDGQQVEADGTKSLSFDRSTLPVSCMVQMSDGGMWAGLIEESGSVRCSGTGGSFDCKGP